MSASRVDARASRESGIQRYRWPVRFPTWAVLTTLVTVLYIVVTLGVVFQSPVLSLDSFLVNLRLRHEHPGWLPFVYYYVMFGQRGPATLAFLPFFIWQGWRDRTSRPLVMLVTSLVLLNVSVGVVKLATGRFGPRGTYDVHAVFAGGNIYPSGHVSNAVVLYGLIALLSVNHRKLATIAAVFLSVTVGLGTVYLRTHWFSDVIGGWLAGALVLLVLPIVMPTAQRWSDNLVAWLRRRFGPGRSDGPLVAAHRPIPNVRTVRILSSAELGGIHHAQREDTKSSAVRADASVRR